MEGNKLIKDSNKPRGVFYIDSSRAIFYEGILNTAVALDFPTDVISDLEVINRKKLEDLLASFIQTHKISPQPVIILLSNQITFEKDFEENSAELERSINEFLELIPFEGYVSTRVLSSRKIKVVAANKELCETAKNTFLRLGFTTEGILPLSAVQIILPELANRVEFSVILNKIAELKGFDLLPDAETNVNYQQEEKRGNKRRFILLGAFGILVVILLFSLKILIDK